MKIVNLTPHTVTIFVDSERIVRIPPSGTVARCSTQRSNWGELSTEEHGSIPITELSYGDAVLPSENPDVIYVVSILVAQSSNRRDLYVIDEEVRNDVGAIIGAKRLARLRRSEVEDG